MKIVLVFNLALQILLKCPLDCIQEQNETITTIRKTFVQKHLIVTKSPLQCRSKRK